MMRAQAGHNLSENIWCAQDISSGRAIASDFENGEGRSWAAIVAREGTEAQGKDMIPEWLRHFIQYPLRLDARPAFI